MRRHSLGGGEANRDWRDDFEWMTKEHPKVRGKMDFEKRMKRVLKEKRGLVLTKEDAKIVAADYLTHLEAHSDLVTRMERMKHYLDSIINLLRTGEGRKRGQETLDTVLYLADEALTYEKKIDLGKKKGLFD